MKNWLLATVAVAVVALGAGTGTCAEARMTSAGHPGGSGFSHGFRGFHGHPLPAFRRGYGGFVAGPFLGSGRAVGDDFPDEYDDNYDPGLNALHFRVQEPFGPDDVGRPQASERPPDSTGW
jgi:hypothetical protein